MRDSLPAASDVFADLPSARPDDPELRATIRSLRAAGGRLLGVIDDDPTGSQAVHGVQVVTVLDEGAYQDAFHDACPDPLRGDAATCFVLTNSRSVSETDAVALTTRAARGLISVADRRAAPIDLISRSDSTLRGHVIAEMGTLTALWRERHGAGPDGLLLVPAFIEAGRVTAADIHWARVGQDLVPVGSTEFARDLVFGYLSSDLRDFLAEKSRGAIRAEEVRTIGLAEIRTGGVQRVRQLLAGTRDARWVIVNAAEYSDLEIVACAVLLAEQDGQSFLFRTGPSFVRALSGIEPKAPLREGDLHPATARSGHGLVVAGSHVAQTSRQLADLRAHIAITAIELDVAGIVASTADAAATARAIAATALSVIAALDSSDVLLYTSRTVVRAGPGEDDLMIARVTSAALAGVVRQALAARPAWIIAKGGITSHDVALHGLGIRRAEVAGQLYPGLISVLRPVDGLAEAIGMPYVVFPGNVGDEQALTKVVAIMHGQHETG